MRSFDRLHKGLIRILPAAALLAALFVPLVATSADDDCPPDGCPIAPPQSREVNPAPAHADGSAVEVPKAGELPPVEITVHVLAPTFVDPAPIGASFAAISIPVRYQDPGDVSCGVQALGMALDALPGAAPTSASLLGLLEGNGMMYDFGTGVEELAYAAQSFGYKGSFAFHGASFEQLQAQVSSGSPIVVSLGLNGKSAPGHFVTVTGISSDGRWVAYNDPTLGEQVISASEFERLWGLQGDSGVVVATQPPAEVADPGVLSLWVAFAAGLMALVSTTPLAKLRQGIGGILDAGGGGNYKPVRSAPKSSPPAKEKEKEPKKSKSRFDDEIAGVTAPPKATTARFDDEIALPSTPVSTVVATPTELKAAQNPPKVEPVYPKARFDEEIVGAAPQDEARPSKIRSDKEDSSTGDATTALRLGSRDDQAAAWSSAGGTIAGSTAYVGVEYPAFSEEGDTPPLEERAATALLVVPVLLIADVTLALLTMVVSSALAADPELLTKLALASVDLALAAADLYIGYQHLNYAHWIVTGNTIDGLDDLQDWAWRP